MVQPDDIRHCFAGMDVLRPVLGRSPRVSLDEGLREPGEWIRSRKAFGRVEMATRELAERGLRL